MPKPVPEMSFWVILTHSMDPIYWMHHRTWVFFPKKTSKWRYLLVMGFRTIQQIGTCDVLWHHIPLFKGHHSFRSPWLRWLSHHSFRTFRLRQAAALVSHRPQGERRRTHGGSKAWRCSQVVQHLLDVMAVPFWAWRMVFFHHLS